MPRRFEPYAYQRECLGALALARAEGRNKALVVMATGLGKTVVSAFDIKRLLQQAPGRVLYLCHDNRILRQSRKTYETVLGKGHTYGYFHGTEKHMHHVDVLFASLQTMVNWREAFLPGEFRYVVVDEFHHAHASTFRPTIEYFTPEFMVGLTATPERGDGLDITKLLGKPAFELRLFKALARGYLCNVDYRVMTDEVQNSSVLDTPVGKLSIAELNRTIFIPKRDEEIARIIGVKMAEVKNPRAMIFCASIAHAERMAELMPHAAVIHSKLKENIKEERLEAFRTGDVTTILTVDMLNEGIDVPEANVIVFLRSTASRRIFLQQLGRGLRKAAGKLGVLVLDFVANCERFEMIDQLQKGVQGERNKLPSGPATDEDTRERQTFTLTLDGVEFDERLWKIFDVISDIHQGYTKEGLTEQLQQKAARLGRAPTATEVNGDPNMAAPNAFYRVFKVSSWNEVLLASGISPRERGPNLEELRRLLLAKANDGILKKADVDADPSLPSARTVIKLFGATTWNSALPKIGLKVGKRRDYSVEELSEQLITKTRQQRRTPTVNEVNDDLNMASASAFYSAFKTTRWNSILRAVGLTPGPQREQAE